MKTILHLQKLLAAALVILTLPACQKEVAVKADALAATQPVNAVQVNGLQINTACLKLLQGNANNPALTVNWKTNAAPNDFQTAYVLEAAIAGAGFTDAVEVATTRANTTIQLGTQDLNKQICKLVLPGTTQTIAIRIRAEWPVGKTINAAYTDPVAVDITTYNDYIDYPDYIRIPGNFANWKMNIAPKIVATRANGVYEGVLNFNIPYPQFLVVKGDDWNELNTFTNIGNGKFGFGGDIFGTGQGAGFYMVRVNTNTNQWTANRINTWGIHGTAVGTAAKDPQMVYDAVNDVYTITVALQKGNFRFRANDNDAITLGNTALNGYTIPDAAGNDFVIDKEGIYQVKLDTKYAGNYACTVVRNQFATLVANK